VCVGCGRCGRQCTSKIDIYDIVCDLIETGGTP
jgi:heterodisulfide reductase subunit C